MPFQERSSGGRPSPEGRCGVRLPSCEQDPQTENPLLWFLLDAWIERDEVERSSVFLWPGGGHHDHVVCQSLPCCPRKGPGHNASNETSASVNSETQR